MRWVLLLDEVVPLDVEWMEVCGRRCRQAEGEFLLTGLRVRTGGPGGLALRRGSEGAEPPDNW